VQYRMIHASHPDGGAALKRCMKLVGPLPGWKPRYSWGSAFEREVKAEVFKLIPLHRSFGTWGFFLRAAALLTSLFYLEWRWATGGSGVALALALGMVQAMIGLCVQHDANHGAASRDPRVNAVLGFGADLIGGCKYFWMQQHWTHHAYTNDHVLDPDATSADPIVLFHDYDPGASANPRRWWSPVQHLLILPLLSFYWLSSILNPGFIRLEHSSPAVSSAITLDNDWFRSCRPWAWTVRAAYLGVNIVAPFFHSAAPLTVVGHILLMGAAESLHLAALFALSHNFQGVERFPMRKHKHAAVGDVAAASQPDWFTLQVETSSTYGGAIAGWLTGGLNYQIEHHLFPRISSVHYPLIQPVVKRLALKHGVRYTGYDYIWQNARSTLAYLRQVGEGGHWNQITEQLQPLSGAN